MSVGSLPPVGTVPTSGSGSEVTPVTGLQEETMFAGLGHPETDTTELTNNEVAEEESNKKPWWRSTPMKIVGWTALTALLFCTAFYAPIPAFVALGLYGAGMGTASGGFVDVFKGLFTKKENKIEDPQAA